jgi:outer membrane protein assembly factor BamB
MKTTHRMSTMDLVLRARAMLLVAGSAAVLVSVAGCGKSSQVAPPKPKPTASVHVAVVDGDTGAAVPRARVTIGTHAIRSDRRGLASVSVRGPVRSVTVTAPGFSARTLQTPSGRRLVVRLYKPAAQWTMYGVTPTRVNAQAAIRVRPPFRTVWSRNLYALLEFPAVVADGVAYVWNGSGFLYAISMQDGSIIWRFSAGAKQQDSSPAVAGDVLVAHSKGGRVLVFDKHTGHLLWQRQVGSPIESSPVVIDGVDYFGDWGGTVYALDLRTRRLRWSYHGGCKITASASIARGTLYIGDYCGRLLAFGAKSGKLRFSASAGSPVYGSSAIANGRVYTPSRDSGALVAFTTSGRRLWSVPTGGYVYSAPAVWRGRVYFGSYTGWLYSVSASSGRVLWRGWVGGRISGSPTVVDGVVYAGSFADRIVGFDAGTGHVVFRFPHGYYVAVAGNEGRLLLHSYSGLWAVESR